MANILVVDDELGIRDLLSEILNDEGHHVELAENAAQARAARGRIRPDLVLLDIWMPDTDGVTLLKEWSTTGLLSMPVIMMSGHATIETAVEATKIGAQSFLEKPITMQKLLKAVEGALTREPAGGGIASATARKPGMAGVATAAAPAGGWSAPRCPRRRHGCACRWSRPRRPVRRLSRWALRCPSFRPVACLRAALPAARAGPPT